MDKGRCSGLGIRPGRTQDAPGWCAALPVGHSLGFDLEPHQGALPPAAFNADQMERLTGGHVFVGIAPVLELLQGPPGRLQLTSPDLP